MSYIYAFHAHHVFAKKAFYAARIEINVDGDTLNVALGDLISDLFSGSEIKIEAEMSANKIGLFVDPSQVENLQPLVDNGNFGSSSHPNLPNAHPNYDAMLVNAAALILNNTNLSDSQKIDAIIDLHFFATRVAMGTAVDGGGNIVDLTSSIASLEEAYAKHKLDMDAAINSNSQSSILDERDAHLARLENGQDIIDDTNNNNNMRFDLHQSLLDARSGELTSSQIADFQSQLNNIQSQISQIADANGNWFDPKLSGQISSIGVQINYLAKQNSSIVSWTSGEHMGFIGAQFYTFIASESGAVGVPDFEPTMDAFNSISQDFEARLNSSPSLLSAFGPNAMGDMVTGFDNVLVGIGGGLIGDTAEFLNVAYDALKHGFATDDWGPMQDAVVQFGFSAVISAVLVTGTVAIAGPLGWAVAAAWAGYGIYDGWNNLAQLAVKVGADLGNLASGAISSIDELLNNTLSLIDQVLDADLEWDGDWLQDMLAHFLETWIDPLVIDLDGDGVELIGRDASDAYFDLDDDGFAEQTGWVSPDDGLLVADHNNNGQIDDITELFGSATETGYEELAAYDSNGDGVVDATDANFGDLKIWRDLDGDGVTDPGELSTLTESGIASIGLDASPTSINADGNLIVETATVTRTDGTTTTSAEVLFNLSQTDTTSNNSAPLDEAVYTMPFLPGSGELDNLWVSMTENVGLRNQASSMIEDARNGQFAAMLGGFDNFLANWGGVSDVQWYTEVPGVYVIFAYEPGYSNWTNIDAYIFDVSLNAQYDTVRPEAEDWAEENGYVVPAYENVRFVAAGGSDPDPTYMLLTGHIMGTTSRGGGTRATGYLEKTEENDPTPDFAASKFAFIQKVMGMDYRRAENFIAPDDLLVIIPEPDVMADIAESYEDMRDHMSSRFLVQSAWSTLETDDATTTPGYLEPFKHLVYSPFTDSIHGDEISFARDVMAAFRDNGLGTDEDALALLGTFGGSLPSLVTIVATEFPEIDRAVIEAAFGVELVEGTAGADTLTSSSDGAFIGYAGNDRIEVENIEAVVLGAEGNDTIVGGGEATVVAYRAGDGSDLIHDYDYHGTEDADLLVFSDLTSTEVSFANGGGNDQDLIMTVPDGSTLTWEFHFIYHGYNAVEGIAFADGVLLNMQEIRDKTVSDMKDSGFVHGSRLQETYYHAEGDGSYLIYDRDAWTNGAQDHLVFTDLSVDQVSFANGVGSDFDLIMTTEGGDVITWELNGFYSQYNTVEQISFADGTVLDRAEIRQKAVEDMKASGAVIGTPQPDIYHHRDGDGSYSVSDAAAYAGIADRFYFDDLTVDQVSFYNTGGSSDNFVMTTDSGDVITWLSGFREDNWVHELEEIVFLNGVVLDDWAIRHKMIEDSKATGTVNGTERAEHYSHTSGDGSYTVYDYDYYSDDVDRFTFTDLTVEQVTFANTGGSSDNLVMTTDGGEVITWLAGFRENNAYNEVEEIVFSGGVTLDDWGIRHKMIEDAKSTGTVNGTEKTEHYSHADGDGSYTINDYDYYNNDTDRLVFTDLTADQVSFANSGTTNYNLIITTDSGDVITVSEHFEEGGKHSIEEIEFSDGTVLDKQAIRNKSVADMKPGYVIGTRLAEDYYHAAGDGSYSVHDYAYYSGTTDRLFFTDLNSDQVSFAYVPSSYESLVMTTSVGDVITWQYFFNNNWHNNQVEQIIFADGEVYDVADIKNAVLAGTDGNDNLTGLSTYDLIDGGLGNDSIRGMSGNDTLVGGDGSDTLNGNYGNDSLYGDSGNDHLLGNEGNDQHFGGAGNDWMFGDGGNDTLHGDAGNDSIYGGVGNDYHTGASGDDSIKGWYGNDTAYGGSGNDTIYGDYNSDQLHGDDGNDWVHGGDGNDTLYGNEGNDSIYGGNGFDIHYGGAGNDRIKGWWNDDTIYGGTGSDTMFGEEHQDRLYGDADGDWLSGGNGHDTLYGGEGDDTLNGDSGNDYHYGEGGNDLLIGNFGADYYDGGDGIDTLDFTYNNGNIVFDLTGDQVTFSDGSAQFIVSFENVVAGNGADTLLGTADANRFDGGGGNDVYTGHAGADEFVFAIGDSDDRITDFEIGIDTLHIAGGLSFADVAVSDVGSSALVEYGTSGDSITLEGIAAALVTEDQFVFLA